MLPLVMATYLRDDAESPTPSSSATGLTLTESGFYPVDLSPEITQPALPALGVAASSSGPTPQSTPREQSGSASSQDEGPPRVGYEQPVGGLEMEVQWVWPPLPQG